MKLVWNLITWLCFLLSNIYSDSKRRYYCNENTFKGGIDKDDIAEIENHINTLRARVANGLENSTGDKVALPTAEDMNVILWDNDLEEYAQEWANTLNNNCDELYTCDKKDDRISKSYGNSAELVISTFNGGRSDNLARLFIMDMIDVFYYGEIGNMLGKNSLVVAYNDYWNSIGHLTTILWGPTKSMGCGYSASSLKDEPQTYKVIVVCEFGPGGNSQKNMVYSPGEQATKCENGRKDSRRWPGLCDKNQRKCKDYYCKEEEDFQPNDVVCDDENCFKCKSSKKGTCTQCLEGAI